jgi:solute carrier family 25 citrate transporter 1
VQSGLQLRLRLGFVAFDSIKSLLQDENGKISGPKTVVAGFGAGFTESLLAVTPFESIKTQLFALPSGACICVCM